MSGKATDILVCPYCRKSGTWVEMFGPAAVERLVLCNGSGVVRYPCLGCLAPSERYRSSDLVWHGIVRCDGCENCGVE